MQVMSDAETMEYDSDDGEGFIDVPEYLANIARRRQSHREYLERTGNRTYTRGNGVGVYSWPLATVRDTNYYRQLWSRIAADWRFFAVQDFANTFGTLVYLPLRRAVRGFSRRWRARNQWRLNIPGIPVAGIVWDANNPRLGRRPQGGESGLYLW